MNVQRHPGSAGVVFDCDGVLVNTQAAWTCAFTVMLERYGIAVVPTRIRLLTGLPLELVGLRLAELLDHRASASSLAAEAYGIVQQILCEELEPMPGAIDLVRALSGARPLAVASNAPAATVRGYLRRFFELSVFDAILGSDDVVLAKPAPDIYLAACSSIGVDPRQAVALEDSPAGGAAAAAAGLYVVGMPPNDALAFPCDLVVAGLRDVRLWHSLDLGIPPITEQLQD
ncbi:HAD family hydrolase [Cryptosporangium sp. NPDC048952]|uniref:HAD family hydrolase n=1 Tax=Cryptosporangium sp. NPDC048952 TaxID=3363961 RepID=UPI003719733D